MLHGEDGQWKDINESTDKEAKEGGTEDDSEEIASSGTMKLRWIMSLENCQVGPTQSMTRLLVNGNVIASMKVIRYGLSFKAIQSKKNFMVLIVFANS